MALRSIWYLCSNVLTPRWDSAWHPSIGISRVLCQWGPQSGTSVSSPAFRPMPPEAVWAA